MSNVFGFLPEFGLISKKILAGYVTIDTAQTITGDKIFNSDLICTQDITTDNLIFGDGTIQSTAYKSLIPGTFTNSTVVVDAFGAISSIVSGSGGGGGGGGPGPGNNYVTIDTVQTITAAKTFSGNVTFSQIQFSYGGDISATPSFTISTPLSSLYTISAPTITTIVVPDPTLALEGVRILFKRIGPSAGPFPVITFRTVLTAAVIVPFNTTGATSAVTMSATQYQTELVYLSNRVLQTNMT